MCESGKGVLVGGVEGLRTACVKAHAIWGSGGTQAEMHSILCNRREWGGERNWNYAALLNYRHSQSEKTKTMMGEQAENWSSRETDKLKGNPGGWRQELEAAMEALRAVSQGHLSGHCLSLHQS